MKAFDILVFMMAFNLSLNLVIVIAGESAPEGADISAASKVDTEGLLKENAALLIGIVVAIAIASITVLGSQATKPVAVVVASFAGFYTWTLVRCMDTLGAFHIGELQLVPQVMIEVLLIFNVLVFIGAIYQMVTGGWRSAN